MLFSEWLALASPKHIVLSRTLPTLLENILRSMFRAWAIDITGQVECNLELLPLGYCCFPWALDQTSLRWLAVDHVGCEWSANVPLAGSWKARKSCEQVFTITILMSPWFVVMEPKWIQDIKNNKRLSHVRCTMLHMGKQYGKIHFVKYIKWPNNKRRLKFRHLLANILIYTGIYKKSIGKQEEYWINGKNTRRQQVLSSSIAPFDQFLKTFGRHPQIPSWWLEIGHFWGIERKHFVQIVAQALARLALQMHTHSVPPHQTLVVCTWSCAHAHLGVSGRIFCSLLLSLEKHWRHKITCWVPFSRSAGKSTSLSEAAWISARLIVFT